MASASGQARGPTYGVSTAKDLLPQFERRRRGVAGGGTTIGRDQPTEARWRAMARSWVDPPTQKGSANRRRWQIGSRSSSSPAGDDSETPGGLGGWGDDIHAMSHRGKVVASSGPSGNRDRGDHHAVAGGPHIGRRWRGARRISRGARRGRGPREVPGLGGASAADLDLDVVVAGVVAAAAEAAVEPQPP